MYCKEWLGIWKGQYKLVIRLEVTSKQLATFVPSFELNTQMVVRASFVHSSDYRDNAVSASSATSLYNRRLCWVSTV